MSVIQSRYGERVKMDAGAMIEIEESMRDAVSILRQPHEIRVSDVSVVGIGAFCPIFVPKGAIFDIRMSLPELSINNVVNIKGEARYCRPAGAGKYKLGIKFVEIENSILESIRGFVAKSKP